MSVARNCPYSDNEENCRYGIFTWVARLNKCSNCERFLKKRFSNIDTSSYNIDENGNVQLNVYTVTENAVEGYTSAQNGTDFTNTIEQDNTVEVAGTKTWVDPEGTTLVHPEITID